MLESTILQNEEIKNNWDETNNLLQALIAQWQESTLEPVLVAQITNDNQNTEMIVWGLKELQPALLEVVQAIKEMPQVEIPEQREVDFTETNTLLTNVLEELKKKEEIEFEMDEETRLQLKWDKGDKWDKGNNGLDWLDGDTPKVDYDKIVKKTLKELPKEDITPEIVKQIKKLNKDKDSKIVLELSDIRWGKEIIKEVKNMWFWSGGQEYRIDGVKKAANASVLNLKAWTGITLIGSPTSDGADITITSDASGSQNLQQVTDEWNTTTNDIIVPDEVYWAWWNGSMEVPTKNALYDKIETLGSGAAIWGAITSGTAWSVLYVNPNAILAQDNQNFNFNNTEKRLSLFSSLWSEVVTNGTFTGNANGWTVPSGMAYSSNSVSKTWNGTGSLTQSLSVSTRREYLLTYTITNWTVGAITPSFGTSSWTAVWANGTYTERFIASWNSISIVFTPTNTARFTIDSVSIKPLTGNSQKTNLNTGGLSIEGSWSNGSPWTTRGQTFNNDGSYTWTDYLFSGVLRGATGANSSGGYDMYTSGGNGVAFYNWNAGLTSNSLYSYNYSGYFYHSSNISAWGYWQFAGSVGAGTGAFTTPTSTLQSAGSTALKVKRLTASGNLDSTASHWLLDATTAAACTGTPSISTCSSYTWAWQAVCESHLPCAWNAGYSCSAFDNEYWMGTCSGTSGCTVVTAACSGANNTDQSTCENQDDAYGGSCSWDTTTCPSYTDTASCNAVTGCTATEWNACSGFDDNYGGCTGQTGCTWSGGGYDCSLSDGTDQWTCEWNAGCTWNSGDSTCSGTCSGSYFSSCDGNLCAWNYNTGSCSGTYWTSCSGTVLCSSYGSSWPCGWEAGCTWSSVLNAQLPDGETCADRTYWIKNDASGGADAIILPYSGQTIEKTTSLTLNNYQDAVHIAYFKQTYDCSLYLSAGACTPTGCTANYSYCSWNSGDNTCSGNAVCVGIGDQGTCEWQSYFSGCSGTEVIAKNWYVF